MSIKIDEDKIAISRLLGGDRTIGYDAVAGHSLDPEEGEPSLTLNNGEIVELKGIDAAQLAFLRERLESGTNLEAGEGPGPDAGAMTFAEIESEIAELSGGLEPAERIARFLLRQGRLHGATDIHLVDSEDGLSMGLKVDDIVHSLGLLDTELGDKLTNYFKVHSDLAGYREDILQEGAAQARQKLEDMDLRVSVSPTMERERMVIRLFNIDEDELDLRLLGYDDDTVSYIERIMSEGNGMLQVVGPSSSGKSTGLYAMLRHGESVPEMAGQSVTIEDPIERRISGISQSEVNPKKGMTHVEMLKHALRQDTKIIMIGEIRDRETASVAIEAALTGHLILSTIHAGDPAEALVRLIELGAKPYQIVSCVKGSLGPRLIRKTCDNCGEPYDPDPELIGEFASLLPAEPRWIKGKGCDRCHGQGYRSRTVAEEFMEIDESWSDLMRKPPTSGELRAKALEAGMTTMMERAAGKAARGETTLEEVKRTIGAPSERMG